MAQKSDKNRRLAIILLICLVGRTHFVTVTVQKKLEQRQLLTCICVNRKSLFLAYGPSQ